MNFNVRYDSRTVEAKVRSFLKGLGKLEGRGSRSVTMSGKAAGEIGILLFALDQMVEEYGKVNRTEEAMELYAEYFYAKALMYALAGKKDEGKSYWDRAHAKKSSGDFAERCQVHYQG